MKHKYIFTAMLVMAISCTGFAQKHGTDTNFAANMADLQDFTDNYKPVYLHGSDTLIVSMIAMPPDYLNKFLFDCIKKRNYKPLKYAAAIFVKQHNEYMNVNHQDYRLEDSAYINNGIVELMRAGMGLGRNQSGVDNIEELTTGDVCGWIDDHAKKIDGFDYVKQFEPKK